MKKKKSKEQEVINILNMLEEDGPIEAELTEDDEEDEEEEFRLPKLKRKSTSPVRPTRPLGL